MADPVTITINLDLDAHLAGQTYYDSDGEPNGSGPTSLEDVVLDMAARALLDKVTTSGHEARRAVYDRVAAIRDEAIREQMAPLVQAAVDAAVQPTNTLGEATCEPTTLRTMIVEQGVAYLSGRDPNRGTYGSRTTRLEDLIAAAVDNAFKRELAQAVADGKAQVLAAIRAQAADALAAAVVTGAGRG